MRSRFTWIPFLLPAVAFAACDDDGGAVPSLPPLAEATTTAEATVVPTHARALDADSRNPSRPTTRDEMNAEGLGDYTMGPGETHLPVVEGGGAAPTPGPGAKPITRFVHFADFQLMDDESPGRLASFDAPGLFSSASRPQDSFGCRMVAAMTRTINAVHAETPVDFVLLGGDNTDNAQENELDWVLTLLRSGGDAIHCDSGDDDDPVRGANNDPKDPFVTPGLDIPFRWVMGNHDVLNQGNFVIDDARQAQVVGDTAPSGTRDFRQYGGPVVKGIIVPDPRRRFLTAVELLTRVSTDGDGHGIDAATASSGRATYTFDVPNTNFRFLVIDTTSPFGAADGLIRQGDVTGTIAPLLDKAQADGKLVFLASHHATSSLTDGGGVGGATQPDAITEAEFVDLITSYPNVVASFVGHTHRHRVRALTGHGRTVWEIMTASLMDFPHQSRLVEISDEDNGFLRIRLTSLDFAVENDPVADLARHYGILDFVAAWADDSTSDPTDRNIDLYVTKP